MLQSEIYTQVSIKTGVPRERVEEYDRVMWDFVKVNLNNPTMDVLEIPFMGSFTITKVKMRKTIKIALLRLRRLTAKAKRLPNNEKVQKDLEIQRTHFKKLWQLSRLCKF